MRRAALALVVVMGAALAAAAASSAWQSPAVRDTSERRGGTLRVDLRNDFDYVDPALAYFTSSWQLGYMTECKLLNFPDREGTAGATPRLEVAGGYKITNGGKTYTFSLRPSYRFSNGKKVTASNFKRAFERVADRRMNSPARPFMEDFVGAKARFAGRSRSVTGVRARGNKLLITLTRPSGDLLSRLAMPFFSAVPTGTPATPRTTPIPSCGPYFLQSWDKQKTATLVRNRFYRGPRPANSDRIVYNIGIALDAQRLRCERGQSDVCGVPPAQVPELRDKYGVNRGRFFVKGQAALWYLNMNSSRPLFRDNASLRRAVNYAIDRPQMVRQHGVLAGSQTDQLIPPTMTGFRDRNLYEFRNVPLARQLAQGNTRDGTLQFWTFNQGLPPSFALGVKLCLQEIGVNTQIRTFPTYSDMVTAAVQPNAQWDMLPNFFSADFGGPDPYAFINHLLRTPQNDRGHFNLSYFNEPAWNARMDAANRLVGSARYAQYGILDLDLMSGPAPIAPYMNPNTFIYVSDRVATFLFSPHFGTDLGALTVPPQ